MAKRSSESFARRLPLKRRCAVWGIVVSILLLMPFASTDSLGQMDSHAQQHGIAPDMPMDKPTSMPMGNKAFSEFSHHLAGAFVLAMALGEFSEALALPVVAWVRVLLPFGMLGVGFYLLIWSDIDAWPLVEGFYKPFLVGDWEAIQHKLYAMLLLATGVIELLRRRGRLARPVWRIPLPLFAIIGGVLLFLHVHHVHTGMEVIKLHHRIMGATAILAGCCKLVPDVSRTAESVMKRPAWDLAWSVLLFLVGLELMLYFE
jgi:hypothetical protein